jgi:hypothetical protein
VAEALSVPGETPIDVHPGDILIVRVNTRDATRELVDEMYEGLRYELPEGVRVLVVAADQLAVVRG